MSKFKPYRKEQLYLLPPSLEDFVPEGHMAKFVYETVEGLDTTDIENKYSELGQNTYHPKILLKLLFYGYATGVRSGRKIAARCESDTAYMYLAEMYRPDFRTINDFRKNNLNEIELYFIEIVRVCKEVGLIKIGEISIDGTKIKANAAARRTKDKGSYEKWLNNIEGEIKKILNDADETDRKEDELYGDKRGDELPEELKTKAGLRDKIKSVLASLKDEEDKKNLTDKDAVFMKERSGVITPAYNCQISVSEGQIITAAETVTERNDRKQLIPMIEKSEQVTEEPVKVVLADSGYASYDNYEYLSDKSKEGYIPDQYLEKIKHEEYNKLENKYHKENFKYDKEKDLYICPEGNELRFYKERDSEEGVRKRKQMIYKGTECTTCAVKGQCTTAKYRTVAREKREELQEQMRQRLLSAEGKQIYKKRAYTVEPVFGHLKYNLGYKNFLLRSLEKVRGEFKLMCIGYNLRKICNYRMTMSAV